MFSEVSLILLISFKLAMLIEFLWHVFVGKLAVHEVIYVCLSLRGFSPLNDRISISPPMHKGCPFSNSSAENDSVVYDQSSSYKSIMADLVLYLKQSSSPSPCRQRFIFASTSSLNGFSVNIPPSRTGTMRRIDTWICDNDAKS